MKPVSKWMQLRDCNHPFTPYHVKVPMECELCGRKLWGSALQCEVCRIRLHPRCHSTWSLMQSLSPPTLTNADDIPSPADASAGAAGRPRLPPPSKLRRFWKGRPPAESPLEEPLEASLAAITWQPHGASPPPVERNKSRHQHVFVACKLRRPRKCGQCGGWIHHVTALGCCADRCEEVCHVRCIEEGDPLQQESPGAPKPLAHGHATGTALWDVMRPLLGSIMASRQTSYRHMARFTLNSKAHTVLLDKHTKRLRSMAEFAAQDLVVSVDDATRVEMLRAVRYACAVYGATLPFYQSIGESVKMHALFRGGIDDTDEAITRQVLAWMGTPHNWLLAYDWYCRPGHPCWMLVHDQPSATLVLALRGTVSLGDLLTDVCGAAVPFQRGHGHSGVVQAADSILQAALPEMETFLSSHRDVRRVMVTGHSLGAGTAALVSMLLRASPRLCGAKVVCYAFAPPPVLDEEQAVACAEFVTSVVFQGDVVPWLCVNNIDTLLGEMQAIDSKLDTSHTAADPTPPFEDLPSPHTVTPAETPLFIPGRLLWLFDLDGAMYCTEPSRTYFNTVPLHSMMVEDHLPGNYAAAVRWLCSPCPADG